MAGSWQWNSGVVLREVLWLSISIQFIWIPARRFFATYCQAVLSNTKFIKQDTTIEKKVKWQEYAIYNHTKSHCSIIYNWNMKRLLLAWVNARTAGSDGSAPSSQPQWLEGKRCNSCRIDFVDINVLDISDMISYIYIYI